MQRNAYADHPQATQDTFAFFVTRYKNKDYASAYPFWKSILSIAPDIQPSVLQGGVDIMKSRYNSTPDAATKTAIADTILALAEAMPSCLGSGNNSYISIECISGIPIERVLRQNSMTCLLSIMQKKGIP